MEKVLSLVLTYLIVFGVGGLLCVVAQFLIIRTKLTPARILVIFLIGGILLQAFGLYEHIFKFAQAGISVPIIGFGAALAKGAIETAAEFGFFGAFAGGLIYTSYGVGVAIAASFVITLLFRPKTKK